MELPTPSPDSGSRPTRIEPTLHPRLVRMRFLTYLLDNSIPLPGGYRIGLDPLLGLLPVLGDFLTSALSFWIFYDAARLGVRKRTLVRMLANIGLEALVGLVPIVGDLVDAGWKANARNLRLVEVEWSPATPERPARRLLLWFALGLILFYSLLFYLLLQLVRALAALF